MKKTTLRIYVGGVNGVGKTALCKLLSKHYRLEYLMGSDMLLKHLKLKKQSQLHKLSEKEKIKLAKKIIAPKISDAKRVVFDTHFFVSIGNRTEENLFLDEYKNLFDFLILITAKPQVILGRRKLDFPKRERELNLSRIIADQQKSQEIAMRISAKFKIPLIEIDNSQNNPDNAFKEIRKVINQKINYL